MNGYSSLLTLHGHDTELKGTVFWVFLFVYLPLEMEPSFVVTIVINLSVNLKLKSKQFSSCKEKPESLFILSGNSFIQESLCILFKPNLFTCNGSMHSMNGH